ncbi:MAG: MraY family glycosyltransferase [Pseudomonadales bacterium]
MSPPLCQAGTAFLACTVLLLALSRVAPRLDLVDSPDQRKMHEGDVPLVGGLAIYLTLLLGVFLWGSPEASLVANYSASFRVFLAAGATLVLLGVLDDRNNVSVFTRVAVEIIAALIVIEGLDLKAASLGDLIGTGNIKLSPWLAYPFTVICIFGVINAFNMLDGMDGLLGMMILITLFSFHLFTGIPPGLITIFISSSLAAFLVSNLSLSPYIPKTFLGDAGSKLLGFIVVALILAATSAQLGGTRLIEPVTALFLVGLPLWDMTFTTLRRVVTRRSPFAADRTHIHHLTEALGLSHRRSLLVIGSIGMASPLLGLMLSRSGAATPQQFYVFIGCFVFYCIMASQAWWIAERRKAANTTDSSTYETPIRVVYSFDKESDSASG